MLWLKKKKRRATVKKYSIKERIVIITVLLVLVLALNLCTRCKNTGQQETVEKGIYVPENLRQKSDSLDVKIQELKTFFNTTKK
jgi:alpha-N-acetylglucosamine transferase